MPVHSTGIGPVTDMPDGLSGCHRGVQGQHRGMITSARIRKDLEPRSLGWISALTTDGIRALLKPLEKGEKGEVLDPPTLVPDTVAELVHPSFPGERLLVCLNPRLRAERARRREDLLRATGETLAEIARKVHRPGSQLRGKVAIAKRIGREANRRKVEKHFDITIGDDHLSWSRKEEQIAREARLDGIHVVRTSLPSGDMSGEDAVSRPARACPGSNRPSGPAS